MSGAGLVGLRSRRSHGRGLPPDSLILGSSSSMAAVRREVYKAVVSDSPVLIHGACGTGKEILARFIHRVSGRGASPFIPVDCSATPASLMGNELFGPEREPSGLVHIATPGLVARAGAGSLFLDELVDLDIAVQARLAKFLEERHCRPGGEIEQTRPSARLFCATAWDPERHLRSGAFSPELYRHLRTIRIDLPPLRDRREDVLPLAEYFVDCFEQKFAHRVAPLSGLARKLLSNYDWPGNIRQLENVIKRFVLVGEEDSLTADLIHETPCRQAAIAAHRLFSVGDSAASMAREHGLKPGLNVPCDRSEARRLGTQPARLEGRALTLASAKVEQLRRQH